MTKTVILDTNVLYDIGLNRVRIEDIGRPKEHFCYSPISIIELVSKLNDRSFADRKAAAGVILKHRIDELPDPESYLTTVFGYKLAEPAPSYSDAVRALAEGQSLEEVRRGVPDYEIRVRRRLNVPFAATWREKVEQEWVDSLVTLMTENVPGFQEWYAKDPEKRASSVPKLRGEQKKKFLAGMKSREWAARIISACQMRAFFKADKNDLGVFTKQRAHGIAAAIPKIECYSRVYTQYLISLMTEGFLPQQNDSGDIEFFLYSIDDDHVVATKDNRWINIAKAAGFARRIRQHGCELNETALAEDRNCVKEEAAKYRKMDFEDYIDIRPGVRSGKPCFKGTRITVYDVLEYLEGGMTEVELLADFPTLTPQHIRAAREFDAAHNIRLAPGSTA